MRKTLFGVVLLCLFCDFTVNSKLIITELMQSNINLVLDDLNDFPDSWVEVYNSGQESLNLSDYSIGIKNLPSEAYKLPEQIVAPGEYCIIFCDKENKKLHTNFRIESGNDGAVYLFKGNEKADERINLPKMITPNVSQGLIGDEWGWMLKPTPGAENCSSVCKGFLSEPVFSHRGRVCSEQFVLDISVMDSSPEGTVIRYTLDGSEPSLDSPVWESPMKIESSTIVKAALFCDGYITPYSNTESFIFLDREMTLPIVSLTSDRDYFYGEKLGILVNGTYNPNRWNYLYPWRRPVNIELFEALEEPSKINQLGETRIKGQSSRFHSLKSLALYANKRFGNKNFKCELFPDDAPGITKWPSFELRNSGNDFTGLYFRDALIQYAVAKNADLDYAFYRPAVVFFNGEYMGLFNIRSRSNDDLIYSVYNGLEDIDFVEKNVELKAGTMDNFLAFQNFYSSEGHTLDEYRKYMDVEEYTNMMLMNIIFDNKDFPGNNIVCWRPREEGGLWRWIAKDADDGLGLGSTAPEFNNFNWLYEPTYDSHYTWANKPEHTLLFRNLMSIDEYRQLFIDRCAIYMGDFLKAQDIVSLIDKMSDVIRPEYQIQRDRFNLTETYDEILDFCKDWITRRIPFFYNHIAEFYNLGTPVPVVINNELHPDIHFSVNGIDLVNNSFDGQYFTGKELVINAKDDEGEPICGLKYIIKTDGEEISASTSSSQLTLTIPQGASFVSVNPVNSSAIEEITAEDKLSVYDLSGRYFGEFDSKSDAEGKLPCGLYILRQGSTSFKCRVQ